MKWTKEKEKDIIRYIIIYTYVDPQFFSVLWVQLDQMFVYGQIYDPYIVIYVM